MAAFSARVGEIRFVGKTEGANRPGCPSGWTLVKKWRVTPDLAFELPRCGTLAKAGPQESLGGLCFRGGLRSVQKNAAEETMIFGE